MSDSDIGRIRESVLRTLVREMEAVRREIEAFPDDASVWHTPPGIANSAGNLTLHLVGNLRHFIGHQLGGLQYARDRDAEFASRGVPRTELVEQIDHAIHDVVTALRSADEAQLAMEVPTPAGVSIRADILLMHLATHTAYHLGQIDYHRRLTTGNPTTVQTLPLGALVGPIPESPRRA